MVLVFLLFHLFLAVFMKQDISQGSYTPSEVSTSTPVLNKRDTDDNEILSMIKSQSAVCPYVRLCAIRNTSTPALKGSELFESRCCSECSCNDSCVASGTCCPDFVHEMNRSNTSESKQTEPEVVQTEDMDCVKTQYGPFNMNNDGFRMVAKCPCNFTDKVIKTRCEVMFHTDDFESMGDIFPVFDKETAKSYKNIYCFLCNKASNKYSKAIFQSVAVWDVHAHCLNELISLIYVRFDQFSFAHDLIRYGCNLAFTSSYGAISDSNMCKVYSVIEACSDKYVGTKMEKLCNKYTWPIQTRKSNKIEFFKNYACLLCNDKNVIENCYFDTYVFKSTIFFTKFDQSLFAKTGIIETDDGFDGLDFKVGAINRYFPDTKGTILCNMGFIFDSEMDVCRQVHCPINFFLQDGRCVPMIQKTTGVVYSHLFEALLPGSVDGQDTREIEKELVFVTDQILHDHFGAGNYNLSLWCNENVHTKMNRKRQYFLMILLWGHNEYGNYVDFLKLLTEFRAVGQMKLSATDDTLVKKVFKDLKFHFSKNFQFGLVLSISGNQLFLRHPENVSINDVLVTKTLFVVRISHFCYRLSINSSEFDSSFRKTVLVKRTHQLLSVPDFQRHSVGKDFTILTCLEDALNGVAEVNRYIFHNVGIRKPPATEPGKMIDERNYPSTLKPADDQVKRSIVAAVVTALLLIVIIGGRILLEKLLKREGGRIKAATLQTPECDFITDNPEHNERVPSTSTRGTK